MHLSPVSPVPTPPTPLYPLTPRQTLVSNSSVLATAVRYSVRHLMAHRQDTDADADGSSLVMLIHIYHSTRRHTPQRRHTEVFRINKERRDSKAGLFQITVLCLAVLPLSACDQRSRSTSLARAASCALTASGRSRSEQHGTKGPEGN